MDIVGAVCGWLTSIGSPEVVDEAAADGNIGMLLIGPLLKPCDSPWKGLRLSGRPTAAIEEVVVDVRDQVSDSFTSLRLSRL